MRVSPEIESLAPYVPGKSAGEAKREFGLREIIKLASNENPLGPSPLAIAALQAAAQELHRYPDPSGYDLKQKIANHWNVQIDEIMLGNGSNEIIDLLIRVFCEPGDRVVFPDKSFVAYQVCSQAARVGQKVLPVGENWHVDTDRVLDFLKNQRTAKDKIFFLANPNNPTGQCLAKAEVTALLAVISQFDDMLFVFDEAYDEFVRSPAAAKGMDFFRQYPNVVVCKTFSKVYGLAGLRLGALIGAPAHLQWLERVRNPFNVNTLAQVAAIAALDDEDYVRKSQELVWRGLESYYDFFRKMELPFWESQANFLMFDSLRDGDEVFVELMKQGLILRPLKSYRLPTQLRISIGTDQENARAMVIMENVLPRIKAVK